MGFMQNLQKEMRIRSALDFEAKIKNYDSLENYLIFNFRGGQ